MKVTVVGAGAMGSLFGGYLAAAGEEVCLVDVWTEHVNAINENGLTILAAEGEKKVKVRAATQITAMDKPDLIIIFVKSSMTEEAARDCLKIIADHTTVLTLQNGVGNVEKICKVLGENRVIAGTTAQGATVVAPGVIKHAGVGDTQIGEASGVSGRRVENFAAAFSRAGIKTTGTDNVLSLIWSKLLINVGINALTAITRINNGQLLEYPDLVNLLTLAVNEAVMVAERKNIRLAFSDPVEKVKSVALATAGNKSSMYQDIERGRKTEIDVINGAIVAEASALGLETPVNKTLTLLVKAIEQIPKQ